MAPRRGHPRARRRSFVTSFIHPPVSAVPVRTVHLTLARSVCIGVCIVAGVAPHTASAQNTTDGNLPSLGAGRVVAQLGTGVVLGPVGYVGGGLATRYVVRRFGGSQGTASTAAERAAYGGTAAATAAGPALVGARGAGHGLYVAALGGAAVGMLGTALVARLNRTAADRPDPPCRLTCRISALAAFTLPSLGATLAYNASRRR